MSSHAGKGQQAFSGARGWRYITDRMGTTSSQEHPVSESKAEHPPPLFFLISPLCQPTNYYKFCGSEQPNAPTAS